MRTRFEALILGGLIVGCVGLRAEVHRYGEGEHWNVYGDFLYMNRSSLHGVSLVKEGGSTVLDSKALVRHFRFEPGYRVGLLYMPNARVGFEAVFQTLSSWEAHKEKTGNSSLSFPFESADYSDDFTQADVARAFYRTQFWDAEWNFWRAYGPRRSEYFAVSGIAGLRFMHWDDAFHLQMGNWGHVLSSYDIHTKNRLLGVQLGGDFQMHPTRWLTWDLQAKGGAFANSASQSQFLGDEGNSVTVRDSDRRHWQAGFYGDVKALLALECFRGFNVHAGYEALFLTGLALAPDQISKETRGNAGKVDRTHGNGVIQGVVAGATLRF